MGMMSRTPSDTVCSCTGSSPGGRGLPPRANLAEGVRGMRIGVVPAFMEAKGLTPEVKAKKKQIKRALVAAGLSYPTVSSAGDDHWAELVFETEYMDGDV